MWDIIKNSKMKYFIKLSIILMFIYSCRLNDKPIEIEVQSKLIEIDTIDRSLKTKIIVMNNSNREISYWENNCSWQDNWKPLDSNFYFVLPECDNNFPVIRTIAPNDSIIYHFKIFYKKELKSKKVDIVFNFIDSKTNLDSVLKIYDNESIILESNKVVSIYW